MMKDYKKRCKCCKYSTVMRTGNSSPVTACYYIGITEKRRGCAASECDKFEPK